MADEWDKQRDIAAEGQRAAAYYQSKEKTQPHPATSRADFWQRDAATKAAALEAARRENIELERHYRAALAALAAAGIAPPIPQ